MNNFFIIIDGPMGSGKTTVAELLHKKLKRTALLGMDRIKWTISDFKRTKKDNTIAADVVLAIAKEYIKHRMNIILEQGIFQKEHIHPFIKLAQKNKMRCYVYQLQAPKNVLLSRLHERQKPKAAKKAVAKSRILRNLRVHSKKSDITNAKIFDSHKLTPRQIVNRILKDIQ